MAMVGSSSRYPNGPVKNYEVNLVPFESKSYQFLLIDRFRADKYPFVHFGVSKQNFFDNSISGEYFSKTIQEWQKKQQKLTKKRKWNFRIERLQILLHSD